MRASKTQSGWNYGPTEAERLGLLLANLIRQVSSPEITVAQIQELDRKFAVDFTDMLREARENPKLEIQSIISEHHLMRSMVVGDLINWSDRRLKALKDRLAELTAPKEKE